MKKQFFRVKQLADQTFSRAGKTEALSDDLQGAERRIEFIKNVCQSSAKKLNPPGVGPDNSAREKRLKKNPDYCLGASMIESASGEEDRLLKEVVTHCGKLLMCLATTHVEHEIKVESKVVTPMSNISDNDYPNIIKLKKTLTKLILDMDSAKTRYQTAVKHHNSSGGSKADSIKDELEEAESKVEQCRDVLACDMLSMMARESEVSQTILEFARLQRNYHTAALAILDEIIPEIELAIDESPCRPVFGRPLEEHLKVCNRKIAFPIELCITALLELGINEEGLFRVTAGTSKVKRMKLSIDANWPNLDLNSALQVRDPHVFTGVLKSYLRELPEPLLTHKLYEQWMAAARIISSGQSEAGIKALWTVLKSLPPDNLNNLHYLIKFFSSLASNKQTNKMTIQNLAIVIAPNLLWPPSEDLSNVGLNMNTANLQSAIVDTLISCVNLFFPEDIEFYQTLGKPDISPRLANGHFTSEDLDHHNTHHHYHHNLNYSHSSVSGTQPEVVIKRTQSNSSLSDQHSPPMGSPKPATRARRQKPAAPNPPVNRASYHGDKSKQLSLTPLHHPNKDKDQTDTQSNSRSTEHINKQQTITGGPVGLDRSPGNPFTDPDESIDPPGNPFDSCEEDHTEEEKKKQTESEETEVKKEDEVEKCLDVESRVDKVLSPEKVSNDKVSSPEKLSEETPEISSQEKLLTPEKHSLEKPVTPTARSRLSIAPPEDPPELKTPINCQSSESNKITETSPQNLTFSAYDNKSVENKTEDRISRLNRIISKSGEGIDSSRNLERSSVKQDRPERPYSTLDRKKPTNKPIPAPRAAVESSKPERPCIPERPANLPRPHSSSFRIHRNTSDSSPDQYDNPVNLERAHMYSVDKQQVSFVKFDKSGENDKPEKPKKPTYLPQTGHQRAMSEGSIIDTGLVKLEMCHPPTSSSSIKDSTNL